MRRLGPKSTAYRFLSSMLESVDGVAVCKPQDYEALEQRVFPFLRRTPKPRVRLIPIGSNIPVTPISLAEVLKYRKKLGWSDQHIVIVYLGFILEAKGIDDLLVVFDRVADWRPVVRLLILGAIPAWNPEFGHRYQALIQKMKYSNHVVWKHYLPAAEVSAWLQCSDFALLPFRHGAVLNRGTLIACIAHGLPVVTTAGPFPVGGPFVNGENVLFAKSGDLDSIVAAAQTTIEDADVCIRLSKGAKRAARYFSWPRIGKEHLDFYKTFSSSLTRRSRNMCNITNKV